ncbi:YfhO family protein [Streptomyces acidiscabies]|uniref:YfhO family protein n=1 Tax=Streptomyces acidiscabies TaxID=42234 RepID=UPI00073E5D8A|nr:YfhO family protein [Streptomyces acidiscabies]GAQ54454.1 bacterial membrane protein YfhO [Streptomyces acidiscabies]GAV44664.1 bacterial membrane protein YfhO [Streptomyces acidiscabies]
METTTRTRRTAARIAALLTLAVFCAADAIARSFPFGPRTRNVNDLGNQYLPYHAHLWDLLHGRADGGLVMNWQSGFGASFLPDFATYVSSPFALLVGVFPRDEIDLAVYVITVLKTACAAAAMSWLLLRLRPGPRWAAVLLGVSYALCGWSLADASYNLMWLDGLIALPVLCLVGEWLLAGRRYVVGVLVVALAWTANFYTAYMATLGAALVLAVRLVLLAPPRRETLATLGRAALTVALGIGLAAPLVTVVYFGSKHASPGHFSGFVPSDTEDVLARLMPTTYGFATPSLYVGTTALLLALALPFHRAVPSRVRWAWSGLIALMFTSMQWEPTQLAWHGFTTPQGSGYREAFVLCGFLVLAAWYGVSYGVPGVRALGMAGGIFVVMGAVASGSHLVRPFVLPIAGVVGAGVLVGLWLLGRAVREGGGAGGRREEEGGAGGRKEGEGDAGGGKEEERGAGGRKEADDHTAAAAAAAAAASTEVAAPAVAPTEAEAPTGAVTLAGAAAPGEAVAAAAAAVATTEAAALARAAAPGEAVAAVAPALKFRKRFPRPLPATLAIALLLTLQLGEATGTSAVTTRLRLAHFDNYAPWGARQAAQAEAVEAADGWPGYRTDPGREQTVGNDPLMVGGQGAQYYSSHTSDVLYRTLTALGDGWTSGGRSLQSLDNAVTDTVFSVGARVHSPPDPHQDWFPQDGTGETVTRQDVPPLVTVRPRTVRPEFGTSPYRNQELLLGTTVYTVPRVTLRGTSLTARCPAGSEAYLYAPRYAGTARLEGSDLTGRSRSDLRKKIAAMARLGQVPATGEVRITLTPNRASRMPGQGSIGCLDTARLHAAADHLRATGATKVTVDDGTIRAELPQGSRGLAVIAAPRIAGWRCAIGDAPAVPAQDFHGLIAAPLNPTSSTLTCTFHTPGLRLGLGVGGVALTGTLLLAAWTARARRRRTQAHAEPHEDLVMAS